MSRSLGLRAVVSATVLVAFAATACAAPAVFAPAQDQVYQWLQTSDAVTLQGDGFVGQRFVRLEDGGAVATYLTGMAIANSLYGMTAALALFSPTSSWVLEVFSGGSPDVSSITPAASTLLISASGSLPVVSNEDAPFWYARGTGYSTLAQSPAAGTPVWLRVRAVGGALGVDSILGVENADWRRWYPGFNPSPLAVTNWDFELDGIDNPEPATLWVVAPALIALLYRRRR